jgi:nucleoside-diphosphate-sugar epimerase
MELEGRVAVVTGGASGIGRAIAHRVAAEGARGVVVADLNGEGAEETAAEIGDKASGVATDVSSQEQVDRLIDHAEDTFGPIDVFFANAGIGAGSGLDAPDEVWERTWAVNTNAHVLAARRLVPGWLERDQMETNLRMLQNCVEPLLGSRSLRHVTMLQGTKAYGIHVHPMPIPARERAPRDEHENFYWLQEDYLKDKAREHGFAWTILRPQLIIGRPWGVAMNLAPIIGVYAAICAEEGAPFSYTGGVSYVWEAVDARLVAEVIEWAGASPAAVNEHFNVTNGDVFEWHNVWPGMAEVLGVEPGPDDEKSMAELLEGKDDVWQRIVEKHALRPIPLHDILGESHHYADFLFLFGVDTENVPPPALVSTVKLRQAGFCEAMETGETLRYWLGNLIERRVLPAP